MEISDWKVLSGQFSLCGILFRLSTVRQILFPQIFRLLTDSMLILLAVANDAILFRPSIYGSELNIRKHIEGRLIQRTSCFKR